MSLRTFNLVLGAPPPSNPDFQMESGWVACCGSLGVMNDPLVNAAWANPRAGQMACEPFEVDHTNRKIRANLELRKKILPRGDVNGLPLWLPLPPGAPRPDFLKLSRNESQGVWERCSTTLRGARYKRATIGANAGAVPEDACWDLEEDVLPIEALAEHQMGWTAPLVLRVADAETKPDMRGDGQGRFWDQVSNGECILDIELEADAETQPWMPTRTAFYAEASQHVRNRASGAEGTRCAIQSLVFGVTEPANACWFLLLDELEGEFRLKGFGGGKPKWSWLAPNPLSWWHQKLAEFCCERLGIDPKLEEWQPVTPVPPGAFREQRWKLFKRGEGPGGAWRELLPAEAAEGWRRALSSAVSKAVAEDFVVVPPFETKYPEMLARELSGRCLLPHSSVRVQLPPCPDEASAKEWQSAVGNPGWLDVVTSAMWPEEWWPRGILWNGEVTPEQPWPMHGQAWQDRFYQALHQQPQTFLPDWQVVRGFRLGSSVLGGSDLLGVVDRDVLISPFELR